MTNPIQIVIDTNVFVSALRSQRGASHVLLKLVGLCPAFEINLSVPLVLEYEEVARRQQHIHGLPDSDIRAIIDYLCAVGNHRDIYYLWRPFLRDPADDMVLEIAVEAGCDIIVTFNGDDFGGVEPQFGIRTLTPAAFLKEIGVLE